MASKAVPAQHVTPFEFELYEDPDHLRTVVASSSQLTPGIDPAKLKLRHRIGRGPFGDVWLATHHQSTEDYDECHEVAVKMLHLIKEEHMRVVLDKFDNLFLKWQGIENVCFLHGISVINGKICIVMKFYEGSIGDKMARLKGGKLSLPTALRHGIELAKGIAQLHAKEILVFNLKPCSFLLNENDQAILGDVGIPFLLFGIPLPSADMSRRLGTPNYMAPEQWQPEIRGPVSFETDSWGFGCSIVEMLTGVQPWRGKSVEEIYDSVVRKQEKPRIPEGLPPPVENVLLGCFEYDFRSRPLMTDIVRAFKSSQNAVYVDGGWTGFGSRTILEKFSGTGYTEWFLSKDHLQVGDMVRSRRPPNSCKPENMDVPEGTVVGLERDPDRDGFVLVRVHGIHDPLRLPVSTLERVTFGLAAGDWVHLKEEDKRHSPVGILHSINRDGSVAVGFIGVETLWKGNSSELQMAEPYFVGQFVRLRANVLSPRFEWPRKTGGTWATGRIWRILPNGCLIVKFPGRLTIGQENSSFLADPAEVEVVSFNSCPGVVKKYQHFEDFHWAVRPLVIALGIFTAMKVGFFVGKKIGRSNKRQGSAVESNGQHMDGQTSGNGTNQWFPPSVKNILGVSPAAR
ncbi:E3 UBIQUITIN-PROTEIN LIGASE KEG-LIKE [Salix purpurea]|uniref:E3 UBIQUITIN-PROTEIN LIGASE KEG-LIKE n=1 Tax=Salix purpurea TaxID=77065 RepID=A0A9Q0Q0K9_SALPP|nr:E3 UBIQUITIN-PROTEIN LIGASE KEG-LIKE [Salix purpurea]KAJ6697825.1 E3 UBIQUITIN-PROTEIN LIGASE KEG-LIKE [Salix purpurea]